MTTNTHNALLEQTSLYPFLEKMSDALLVLDNNWHYTYLNKKAGELLGYEPHELIGQHIWTKFPEAVGTEFYQVALKAWESQQYAEITSFFSRYQKWFERRLYPSGEGLLIFFSDVTDKKLMDEKVEQAQKELQDMKAAINASSIVSFTDAEGRITWVNDNFCKISKYSPEELKGKKHGIIVNAQEPDATEENILKAIKNGQIWKGEVQNKAKDGTPIWVYSTIVPVQDADRKNSHNIIFCQDITERKKAEKALAESEKLYRTLIENYSDAVFLTDLHGNIIKVNQLAESISQMKQEELIGKNFLHFLSPEDRQKISTALPILLQGKNLQFKTIIESFANPFSAVVAIAPVLYENAPRYFFVRFRDISTEVNFEKDLKLLNDATLALSTASTLKEGTTTVLEMLCAYGGFQYAEFWMPLFGQPLTKMKSAWWSDDKFLIMKASSENKSFDIRTDKPELFRNGKWFYSGDLRNYTNLRRRAEAEACGLKSLLCVQVIYRDKMLGNINLFSTSISNQPPVDPERLQTLLSKLGGELERRRSNEELDRFFALSPELLAILCFDGFVKKFNPALQQLLGYSDEEAKTLLPRELVHPDDQQMVINTREKMMLGQAFKNLELRFACKGGAYRWLSCSMQPVVEENLVYLTARDITEQKQQRQEIELIKLAIENTSDAIIISADMVQSLYVNKAFETLLGWTLEALNDKSWTSIFVQPNLPFEIVNVLSEKGSWEGDIELYDTKGNIVDINLRANTFLHENGSIKYLIGIYRDITAQKKAQQEVVKLSSAIEQSVNEVYIITPANGHFTYVNPRALHNLGYSSAEMEKLTPLHINPDYSHYAYKKLFALLLSGKEKSLRYQTQHIRKDGSCYPVEIHLSPFQFKQEKAIMANVVDITERQEAEEALRIINERYRLVTKATNDAIWDCDIYKQISYYGEGYKTIFGHSFGNTFGKLELWIENIHPEDVNRVVGNFYDVIVKNQKEWVIEYRFKCADGSYKFVRDRGYVIYDTAGKAIRMTGALADITEQKRTEALLREFNAELEKKVEEKTSKLGHALRLMRQEVIARVRTEETLQQSLQEKEVLLKEIHHRVKNNMAIISGLLTLQARHTRHAELKNILKDSQSRIRSMALIHELLYQHENLAKINFKEYIHQLAEGISSSFHFLDKRIIIVIDAEDAEMDIVHAVPCALILNELITNCYKYAFNGKQNGQISIGFSKHANRFELSIADNGVGLPADFNPQKTTSLGMQLICSLTRQIGGTMQLSSERFTSFTFSWPA